MGLGGETGGNGSVGPNPSDVGGSRPISESEQERQERFKSGAEELVDLSTEYSIPAVGNIKVTAYLVTKTRVTTGDGTTTPVYLSARRGGAGFYAFVDGQSEIFRSFGADIADILLAEIAYHLKTRGGSGEPLSKLIDELKTRHLPDRKLDPQALSSAARSLLMTIADRLAERIGTGWGSIWDDLGTEERAAVIARATVAGETLARPGETAEFLRHLPFMLIPRVVERHPAVILDGMVLSPNYAALSDGNVEARLILKERTVSYLTDLALLAEVVGSRSVAELHRARYTVELARELVVGAALSVPSAS
jgi:hypothetical protein